MDRINVIEASNHGCQPMSASKETKVKGLISKFRKANDDMTKQISCLNPNYDKSTLEFKVQ